MNANEHQVGGRHYKTEYEHWDLVIRIRMNYLEGNTTKYVSRARKKGGIQDYRKAMHYLDKLIECYKANLIWKVGIPVDEIMQKEIHKFALANSLTLVEEEYIVAVCTCKDLKIAKELLMDIIKDAESGVFRCPEEPDYPGTPADGGHHDTSNQ